MTQPPTDSVEVKNRYAYSVPRPTCLMTYYDINGRLIMWDAFACDTPKEVLEDMKRRPRYEAMHAIALGLGIVVLFLILATSPALHP